MTNRATPAKMHPTYAGLMAAALSIARQAGASVEFVNGRKHAFLVVRRAGAFRKLTISHGTKNIKHQTDWVRQNTRRAIRELDAIAMEARQRGPQGIAQRRGRNDHS